MLGYSQFDWFQEMQRIESTESSRPIISTGRFNVPIDTDVWNEVTDTLSTFEEAEKNSKVVPLVVLTPNVCPSCVSNITDYTELFRKDSLFVEPVVLFIDRRPEEVERFVITTGLELPYLFVNGSEMEPVFAELEQRLVFFDTNREMAFYNEVVPNLPTDIQSKEQVLESVSETWKSMATEEVQTE